MISTDMSSVIEDNNSNEKTELRRKTMAGKVRNGQST